MPLHTTPFFYLFMKDSKFLFQILNRYGWRFFVVFLFNIVSVVLNILVFMMIEPFCKLLFTGDISNLSPISSFFLSLLSHFFVLQNLRTSLFAMILVALGLYFLKDFFSYASSWVMASIRSSLLSVLRNDVYDKILSLPIGYFAGKRRGDILSRAVNDTQEVENTTLNALKSYLTDPITSIVFLAALFYISPLLSLYALLLLPITFVVIGKVSRTLRKQVRTSKQRLGVLLSHLEETLSGLRIIKGFNSQDNAARVFDGLNLRFATMQRKIYRRADLASPLSEFLGVVIVMLVLVIGGTMVLSDTSSLTAPLFITYIALFTQIIEPLKSLSTAFTNFKRGQAAMDRVNELLSSESDIVETANALPVSDFHDQIVFENVTFCYDVQPVVSDFNLTIRKGEIIALVGQSGAGKTTLADLLERFYDPTSGVISLDGHDIRHYKLKDYRGLFAMVSQDVVLFNDTLYNNIVMGLTDMDEKEVWSALKVANLYDFVSGLPEGLNYKLSDRGLNLSGGQRQRISIARAVLRNAPILILDEATSAMDTASERAVQNALDKVMLNRTVLVIAHRLSTIRNADKILVLESGHVVEQGTHDTLLKQGGLYSKFIQIQQFR